MEALRINDYLSSQLDDVTVVRRVIGGEKELFEILLRRHNQTLYRVLRSYLKDEDDIRDAMQNTYLKSFNKLFQFQGNASFSTWLIRIGMNEALLRLKIIKREQANFLGSNDEQLNLIPDNQMNAETKIIRREAEQMLEQAIDNLPEMYRVVYMLKEIEGMSNSEVCESLSLTDSNVKVRLHRAKAMLKDSLYTLSISSDVFEFGKGKCDDIVNAVMKAI
ncbi:MAG: RNA polymerase sigma factor [Chryseolinea sp.]